MRSSLALLLAAMCLGSTATYRTAQPGWRYEFPRDHFAHPEFRTEWWYYTGNVSSAAGHRFGYELTFFRHGVDRTSRPDRNVWDIDDAYMAHFALTDITGRRFYHSERLNRGGPAIAGIDAAKQRIWNGNWFMQWTGSDQFRIQALTEEFAINLQLQLKKPPVIHGENGISRKAIGEGRASHYVSLTRLHTTGTIRVGGAQHSVSGQSWMDHEWFTHLLESDQTGWDWFSLQFDDGTELMLFQLRRKDGSVEPQSAGTWIDAEGNARHLQRSEFSLQPGRRWRSPVTKAEYPVEWRISVPLLKLDLQLRPMLDRQELTGKRRTSTVYWEGAVEVEGAGKRGRGYLEMTGYAGAVRMGE